MSLLLELTDLTISIQSQEIIKGLSLSINPGSLQVIMGPNGSGKSSLSYAIMGHPKYEISKGSIHFNGHDITSLPPHKRAKLGLFLSQQHIPEIPGVTLLTFLKESYTALKGEILSVEVCKARLMPSMNMLGLDESFLHRSLNEGFSGGEKKKCELLQLLFLEPPLAILDEIDSGIDIDAMRIVTSVITQRRHNYPGSATVLITHNPHILSNIQPDYIHVMNKGKLVCSGDNSLIPTLSTKGYNEFLCI